MANLFLLASTTATISLILLFLSPLSTANSPVLDTDGNPLQPGSRYYVLTSGWGAAGRGGLAAGPELTCPQYVFQFSSWRAKGIPVTVIPSNSNEKEITIGMDVSFAFGPNAYCGNDVSAWKLTYLHGVPVVSTDGTPGDASFGNTFEIREASPGSYKIAYRFPATPAIYPPLPPHYEQLYPIIPSPPLSGSFLSLAPINKPLPFFGFVFSKVDEGGSTY